MSETRSRLQIYSEYIQDLDLSKRDVADAIGCSVRMLNNYLNENNRLPIEKEYLLINFLNSKIGNNSFLKPISNLLVKSDYNDKFVELDLNDLKQRDEILKKIPLLENQFNLKLFDTIFDSNFNILRFAYEKPYFKTFLSTINQLFEERKSLNQMTTQQDKLFIQEAMKNQDTFASNLNKYIHSKNKYSQELNEKLEKCENEINVCCKNFLDTLLEDYINS